MPRNKKKIIRACTVSMSCTFFDEIMRKMREDGYEMVAVTSPGPELDELKADGFRCIEVPMERHISVVRDIISLIKMICVFAKEKPYVVHSMTPKAGLICMIAGWLTRVPVRIHTFTGLVWPTAVGMKRKVLMAMDKILCACATHIIPEGEGVKNDLKTHITKKPMKVLGYGNVKGVDMERFDPVRAQKCNVEGLKCKEGGCFTFLFVGRIVGDKGVNELVEAFCRLRDEFQKVSEVQEVSYHDIRLVLVGRCEEELDPISEITQQRIEGNDAIMAVGSKYGDDLLGYYATADCFVMPSYREGFPNTVLEAGAMGLPGIVTDINGSREIIYGEFNVESLKLKEGGKLCKNGIVVPPKDADALYEAMKTMVEYKEMREEMAKNARPMIESRYEQGFVRKCLMEFYEEVMK